MKRVVFIAVFILIILLVFIYVFIPSTITAGKTVSVKCVNKNVLVLIGNKQGWSRWLPKESIISDLIQYKGYQLKLGSATYSSVVFDALKDADVVFNEIGFVKDSITKTKISVISSVATGMNTSNCDISSPKLNVCNHQSQSILFKRSRRYHEHQLDEARNSLGLSLPKNSCNKLR